MNAQQILYGSSVLLSGLVAGLFYAYQCSIINGLGALNDRQYLSGFQSINREILNPLFFFSFMGSLIALPILLYVAYKSGSGLHFPYVLTATLLYVVGAFGITVICNVPLNEALARFDILNATDMEIQAMRAKFEPNWNRWHLIRTLASIACFISLIIPLIKKL